VALWPVDWRRRRGARANRFADGGEPWDRSEWLAFREAARDLTAAEARGEVPVWSYSDRSPAGGLRDEEVVAAIDRAFAPPRKRPGCLVWRAE
jgi:hypothetical protein